MSGSIKTLESHRPTLFAFEIDGHVKGDEVADLYATLEKAYKDHDKVDVLLKITNMDGWDWDVAVKETTWIGKTHALSHIRRYALVGGPSWMHMMVNLFDPLFTVRMKTFGADDETGARVWLDEGLEAAAQA